DGPVGEHNAREQFVRRRKQRQCTGVERVHAGGLGGPALHSGDVYGDSGNESDLRELQGELHDRRVTLDHASTSSRNQQAWWNGGITKRGRPNYGPSFFLFGSISVDGGIAVRAGDPQCRFDESW